MRSPQTKARLAVAGGALLLVAGLASTAAAATITTADAPSAPIQITPSPAPTPKPKPARPDPRDEPLVSAFEQVSQSTQWTLSKTIQPTWIPAGVDYEQEGFKAYGGRFYISVYDHTDNDGHLLVIDGDGSLVKDIAFVDGDRTHAGGFDVYGGYAYVPLAVDSPNSSADILRINLKTFQVTNLFTVTYDHVGGVIYNPVTKTLVGQSWDSRTFYEWTLSGKQVDTWKNPTDYVGYQDCQHVSYDKMLCSGASEGIQSHGGFDLIDLGDPEHAILNGVPTTRGGNANEILATRVDGGIQLTNYAAGSGPIEEWTTVIPQG